MPQERILYPMRDLSSGLYTVSDDTRQPPNTLQTATNIVYADNVWKRKRGRERYNGLAFCEVGAENIAQWRLNDNLGDTDVVDSSGNAHTGTSSVNTSTAHATPKVGSGSLDFNGDRYVTVADAADLSFGDATNDSAFSLAAWIYVEAGTGYQTVISKWDETTGSELREWVLCINSGEVPEFDMYDESEDKYSKGCQGNTVLSAGWHHLAVTYDGTGGVDAAPKLYVDGALDFTATIPSPGYVAMENTASQVIIGAIEGTGGTMTDFVKEKLDDVRIFNAELTVAEVSFIYNAGRGIESLLGELEVKGVFKFATTGADSMLAVCNGSFYKTTGDGSMGSALTMPDASAVAMASADFDTFGVLYRNKLHIFTGDTTDYPYIYDGTNVIDTARTATGTADSGDTTTFVDDALTEAEDYWNGLPVKITDATDGTVHYAYVTNFVAASDTVTFSPTCTFNIDVDDTYTIGLASHNEKNGKYAILFKNRIFCAVDSTVYFTRPYYPGEYTENGTLNAKYPSYDDGEVITGLAGMGDYLVVFKPHRIYAYRVIGNKDSWSSQEVKGWNGNKGAVWHRTIDAGFGGLIYMSYDGIYVLERSFNVRCISRNIDPTIKALAQSVSNPGGMSSITKTDTTKVDFDAGTDTNIDTATESGTFRVALTTEAIDQQQTTYPSSRATFEDDPTYWNINLGQSFKLSVACTLTKVQLYIKRVGSYSGNISLTIHPDDANKPDQSNIVSKTYVRNDVPLSYSWITFDFTDTNLEAGTRYWLVLRDHLDSSEHYIVWGCTTSSQYADGQMAWYRSGVWTLLSYDGAFKVYEQHYESSSNLISQIHDLGAVPTAWRPFIATETLNGCTVVYQVRSDDDSGMASPTAWTTVENGGTPSITLLRYVQWKCTFTPTNVVTPVVDDVTIQAYLGTAVVAPCAKVHDKSYWLSVIDTPEEDTTNSCVYWLDEEAWLLEQKERWSKLDGIYANYFTIFNDQLMSGSVGGTGLGGFLYYEGVGNKDLGSEFTHTIISKKDDYQAADPSYVNRRKVYLKLDVKYKSNVASSLYYKIDSGDWSSALSLSAKADTGIERESFNGLCTGRYITWKQEGTSADNEFEWHGLDILTIIKPFY